MVVVVVVVATTVAVGNSRHRSYSISKLHVSLASVAAEGDAAVVKSRVEYRRRDEWQGVTKKM